LESSAARTSDILTVAGVSVTIEDVKGLGEICRVPADQAPQAISAAKQAGFDFMIDLHGIDTGEGVEVVYHLRSLAAREEVIIKATLAYGGTLVSVWATYPAALTPERECAEMFGLFLDGHPNPKRLLTIEGGQPPLLKSTRLRTVEEARNR